LAEVDVMRKWDHVHLESSKQKSLKSETTK
jgi:hypothetical protein